MSTHITQDINCCKDMERSEKEFLDGASKMHNLIGLKGHRSVGGIRASNYNTISVEQAQKLADYLNWFASTSS